jgi:hypothetical protein
LFSVWVLTPVHRDGKGKSKHKPGAAAAGNAVISANVGVVKGIIGGGASYGGGVSVNGGGVGANGDGGLWSTSRLAATIPWEGGKAIPIACWRLCLKGKFH